MDPLRSLLSAVEGLTVRTLYRFFCGVAGILSLLHLTMILPKPLAVAGLLTHWTSDSKAIWAVEAARWVATRYLALGLVGFVVFLFGVWAARGDGKSPVSEWRGGSTALLASALIVQTVDIATALSFILVGLLAACFMSGPPELAAHDHGTKDPFRVWLPEWFTETGIALLTALTGALIPLAVLITRDPIKTIDVRVQSATSQPPIKVRLIDGQTNPQAKNTISETRYNHVGLADDEQR